MLRHADIQLQKRDRSATLRAAAYQCFDAFGPNCFEPGNSLH